MKKLMFNDKFGLTEAVLTGRKTMTRRIIPLTDDDRQYLDTAFDFDLREMVIIDRYSRLKVDEEIAVAQSYSDIPWQYHEEWSAKGINLNVQKDGTLKGLVELAGWNNKMYVRADAMPHRIRITDIKVERLQDISEEDAMREGVFKYDEPQLYHEMDLYAPWPPYVKPYKHDNDNLKYRCNARYAFAYLIDKVSGTGTWRRNPWVFVYSFGLIK